MWEGRTYYREDWGPVHRRAPLRVRDDDDHVRCSLWALDAPLADHLLFDAHGVPRVVAPSSVDEEPVRTLAPAVREGLVEG